MSEYSVDNVLASSVIIIGTCVCLLFGCCGVKGLIIPLFDVFVDRLGAYHYYDVQDKVRNRDAEAVGEHRCSQKTENQPGALHL